MNKLISALRSSGSISSVPIAMLKSHSRLILRIMTILWKLEEQETMRFSRMHLKLRNILKGSKEIKNRRIQ